MVQPLFNVPGGGGTPGGGPGGIPDGGENEGGAMLGGDAMQLAFVRGDPAVSVPSISSTTIDGKRPILPSISPSHQPSSTPLGHLFRILKIHPVANCCILGKTDLPRHFNNCHIQAKSAFPSAFLLILRINDTRIIHDRHKIGGELIYEYCRLTKSSQCQIRAIQPSG